MKSALNLINSELDAIREAGTWRDERIITTPQRSRIDTTKANGVVNMCANNYLGLSNHPELIAAAKASYDNWASRPAQICPSTSARPRQGTFLRILRAGFL